MKTELKKIFYEKLPNKKVEISFNRNPVKMELFLSFLTVETIRSYNHLGSDTLWTLLYNKELKLEISGGIVNGVEYLDTIRYGIKLQNQYNNFVNPFYLFDIMTEPGKQFFIDYYKAEIDSILCDQVAIVESLKTKLANNVGILNILASEIESLKKITVK